MKLDYWQKLEENCFYHIYNRGINKEIIFKTDENMKFFLKRWKELIEPYLDVAAFCLMPNHFHFLARVKTINEEVKAAIKKEITVRSEKFREGQISYNDFLEDQFKRLFQSYALAFNKQQNRTGSLLQKRFKRISVNDEYKRWHLLAYIHHNPIHHRFQTNYKDWVFSSYNTYLSESPTLIIREEVLAWFDLWHEAPRLLNLEGLVNVDEGKRRKATIERFVKYHKEFKSNFKEMGNYYLDEKD
jgi:REP element-mobilizing transposase RayT